MINAKELRDILTMELSPEGKVLLLGMITDGGVDLDPNVVGDKYALIPSEIHVGHIELKTKHMVAPGQTSSTLTVQREVVKYGSSPTIHSTRTKRSKRTVATGKKAGKNDKDKEG